MFLKRSHFRFTSTFFFVDSGLTLFLYTLQDMLCAIAEIESGRQILAKNYVKKFDEFKMGIMQVSPKTAHWLIRYRLTQFDCSNLVQKS